MRRRRVLFVVLAVFGLLLGAAWRLGSGAAHRAPVARQPLAGADRSLVRVQVNEAADVIELVVGPVTLPARTAGYRTPIQLVEVPLGGSVHGFSWRMTDAAGRRLPAELLHHVNLIDPDRRDLFSNTARRVAAAGRETGDQAFTPLIGYPLVAGARLLVVAMFANPGAQPVAGAYLRVRLRLTPSGRVIDPLPVYPFTLDVMGPVGEKSFAVPPGRTERVWEGAPALDVRVLALGGHLHDYARLLRLEEASSGAVLWQVVPEVEDGRVVAVPVSMTWRRGGIRLHRDRRYRIRVVYENPTAVSAEHGGMGVIAGLAHVSGSWPPLDGADPDYRADLESVLAAPRRSASADGHAHRH